MTKLELQELAAAGLTEADVAEPPVELWTDNLRAYQLFCRVGTQWQCGVGGASGLRYEAVYPLMARMNLPDEEWSELFYEIQVMESAALRAMRPEE